MSSSLRYSVHPKPPPVNPALSHKIKVAELAEERGELPPIQQATPQIIIRPSLDASTLKRKRQARTVGLVDPAYYDGSTSLEVLAQQPAIFLEDDLDEVWDTLSEAQKLRAGGLERFRLEFDTTLQAYFKDHVAPHEIAGRLDARNINRATENLLADLTPFEEVFAPDVMKLLREFVTDNTRLLGEGLKQREVLGFNATSAYAMLRDLLHKLIYIELSNKARAMGDRGVRYVLGLCAMARELLALRKASSRQHLLSRVILVHWGLGFATYAGRTSFRAARLVRNYAARLTLDEQERYRPLFNKTERDILCTAVASIHEPTLPWDTSPVLASVRAACQLSPLHPYRVWRLLGEHQETHPVLASLLIAAKKSDAANFVAGKEKLIEALGNTSLDVATREDIVGALVPVDRGATVVNLGTWAGDVTTFTPGNDKTLGVSLHNDDFCARFGELFDDEQERFVRSAAQRKITRL